MRTGAGRSDFRRRVVDDVGFRAMEGRALHLPPDSHVDPKRNRHDHQNTDSQNEKPPEHPHNTLEDSRWAAPHDVIELTGPQSQMQKRASSISSSFLNQPFFAGLACALRRCSAIMTMRSRRLRPVFEPVATFSMLTNASGLLTFSRNSLRNG